MPSNLIIYHAKCYDGFGAAWVAQKYLYQANSSIKPVMLPASYGDDVPNVEGQNVYILDFSYPKEALQLMKSMSASLVVLDHHKSAEANLAGLDYCIFDMKRSGAGMTWDWFYPNTSRPALINYIEDRDLWNWKLPHSHAINSWISSFPMNFHAWDTLDHMLTNNFETCVTAGEAIERYYAQKSEEIAKESRIINIAGYDVPTVNCPYSFGSTVCHLLCLQYPEAKFSAYYLDRADGEQQWGLRSIGDFDVSEIAKQFGGGGHKNAAGYLKNKVSR